MYLSIPTLFNAIGLPNYGELHNILKSSIPKMRAYFFQSIIDSFIKTFFRHSNIDRN